METMRRSDFDGPNAKERRGFIRSDGTVVENTQTATMTAERYRELQATACPPVRRTAFDRLPPEARKAHIDAGGAVFD